MLLGILRWCCGVYDIEVVFCIPLLKPDAVCMLAIEETMSGLTDDEAIVP